VNFKEKYMKTKEKSVYEIAVQKLLDKIDSTESFAISQAPEVCKQLIAEESSINKMDVISGLLLGIVCMVYTAYAVRYAIEDEFKSGLSVLCILTSLISSITSLVWLCGTYFSIQRLIRLRIAPKVFLMRKFKDLLNS
jgi:hypothetical protein